MPRQKFFTQMKEEFSIKCILNMSAALIAQNKTKISFFLCTNFPPFRRHKYKKISGSITPDPHPGKALDPFVGLQHPQMPSCIQEHCLLF